MGTDLRLESLYVAAREQRYTEVETLIAAAKLSEEERCDWFCRAIIDGQKEAAQLILCTNSVQTDADELSLSFLSFSDDANEAKYEVLKTADESKAEVVAMLTKKVREEDDFPAHLFMDFAISEGDQNVVELLLNKSIRVLTTKPDDFSSQDMSTLLHAAVWNSDEVRVASLIKFGARPSSVDLLLAVEKGCLQIAESLINEGADVHAEFKNLSQDEGIRNPVRSQLNRYEHRMSRTSDFNLLYPLLHRTDKKSDVTLLHVAANKGHAKMVEMLVKKDAEINVYNNMGRTPLFTAAEHCHERIVKFLSEHGAEMDPMDDDDVSPLHNFAVGGSVESAKLLLKYGASVDSRNGGERTPLHFAGIFGQAEMVKLLLEHGAKIDALDRRGETPLHLAVSERNLHVVEVLLKLGANVESRNCVGEVPLHIAARKGFDRIVKLLLEHGAQVDSVLCPLECPLPPEHDRGRSALLISAAASHMKVVKILLKSGAKINFRDFGGQTALHIASENGNFDVVVLLLDHGASVELKDRDGKTALLVAVDKLESFVTYEDPSPAHLKIITSLLRYGAAVNAIDNSNRSPLTVTAFRQWKPTGLRVLLDFGSPSHIVNEDDARNLFDKVNESNHYFSGLRPPPNRNRRIPYFQYERIEKGVSTSEILVRHVTKMRAAKLYVGEEDLFAKEFTDQNEIDAFRNECMMEIEQMKTEKIGNTHVSYYDILIRTVHQLQPVLTDETIVQSLSSCVYVDKFPIYSNILKSQFEKGMFRQQFLQGIDSFHFLLNRFHPVPYEIAESIAVKYLGNIDLRNLMNVRVKKHSQSSASSE